MKGRMQESEKRIEHANFCMWRKKNNGKHHITLQLSWGPGYYGPGSLIYNDNFLLDCLQQYYTAPSRHKEKWLIVFAQHWGLCMHQNNGEEELNIHVNSGIMHCGI